jgi:hypothetical protein
MRLYTLSLLSLVIFAASLPLCGQEPLPQQPPAAVPAGEAPATNPAPGVPPAGAPGTTPPADQSHQQMVSYTLGMNFGSNLKQNEIVVDLASLMAGIADAIKGAEPK